MKNPLRNQAKQYEAVDSEINELALDVLGRFRVIFKSANKHFEAIEKTVGVSGAQLWALSEVARADEMTINELAKSMALHQSTTSNLLEKLEGKGLVERARKDTDRRVVRVKATQQGINVLSKAPSPFRGILPDALMHMGTDELTLLKVSLDKLLELLEHKSGSADKDPLGAPRSIKD